MEGLDIDRLFDHHPKNEEQIQRYDYLRNAAKQFARAISEACPECADKNSAIRKIREALMTANAAITING
jgi:hypothetical protein